MALIDCHWGLVCLILMDPMLEAQGIMTEPFQISSGWEGSSSHVIATHSSTIRYAASVVTFFLSSMPGN